MIGGRIVLLWAVAVMSCLAGRALAQRDRVPAQQLALSGAYAAESPAAADDRQSHLRQVKSTVLMREMQVVLEDIDRAGQLSAPQYRKLAVAAKGAIDRYLNDSSADAASAAKAPPDRSTFRRRTCAS